MKLDKKFLKFFTFGLLTYLINMGLTYLLKEKFGLNLYISYFISLFLVTIINFLSSLKLIFKQKYSHFVLIKYLAVLGFTTFLNYLVVNILNIYFGKTYLLIFVVTTFFFFLKFFVYDRFVFEKK
ncbi:MAG: GtrA family protein [Candidatus Gracilibacteria bacterium]|nr:GtrA family protein [Candidatus Gracilibacteria bacterium]